MRNTLTTPGKITPLTPITPRKILVTSALPYSNGDIHLGHLVEYLQTDFWVRFQKMRGHECLYFCADDTHGTPIMIAARKLGIEPKQLIEEKQAQHFQDFSDFEIDFTHYSSTNTEINRKLSEKIFASMEAGGHITERNISQYYCTKNCQMFLPDRFIKGECPNCGTDEQYGDSCEHCSATYSSIQIKNPKCITCGSTPEIKESNHLFFELSHFQDYLSKWIEKHTSDEVTRKLKEWFTEELRAWDISRDPPYFGFEIPGHPQKYFYVWVDAPIGYIGSCEEWCRQQNPPRSYQEMWKDQNYEIYHFIGKDIIYFHSLFWPAMLKSAELSTPTQIFSHGFLTINKEKMSKSKGTFINARQYLDQLHPSYLRYYFASKISPKLNDIDFNTDDFLNKINSELIGKITNLASRSAQMLNKKEVGLTTLSEEGRKLISKIVGQEASIAEFYEKREFSHLIVEVRTMAEEANQYLDQQEPWKLIKGLDEEVDRALQVLTDILNIFRVIAIYLTPILPSYSRQVSELFGEDHYRWSDLGTVLEDHPLSNYQYLMERIEQNQIDQII